MKKLIFLALVTLSILYTSSCNSQPSNTTNENKLLKTEASSVSIEYLTPETFKSRVFNYTISEYKYLGEKPCIIDFYASWCGPCRIMAPLLQTIADDYKDKITVFKVDVDAQKELAASFGITGIPTLLFCPKNSKPQMSSGLLSKTELDKTIKDVLLK